jgi:hypothetical protein
MSRKLILMIAVNVVLALLYVISSYALWNSISGWSYWEATASWSPLYVTPTYNQIMGSRAYFTSASIPIPMQLLNIPFLLFLVISATNLSFIVWLYRSKEKKQNTT